MPSLLNISIVKVQRGDIYIITRGYDEQEASQYPLHIVHIRIIKSHGALQWVLYPRWKDDKENTRSYSLHSPSHLHDIPWMLRGVSAVAWWDNSLSPIVSGNFISIFPFGYQKRGSNLFRPANLESISHLNPILPSSIQPYSLPYLVKLSYDVSFLSRDLHVVLKPDMFVSPRSVDFLNLLLWSPITYPFSALMNLPSSFCQCKEGFGM